MADGNAAVGDGPGKQPYPAKPVLTRLAYAVCLYALQYLLSGPAMARRHWQQRRNPPETYPSIIKTYKSRPRLPVRIFFPKSYRYNDPAHSEPPLPPLPTLFTIHGGGFVVGDSSDNDAWNRIFANQHNSLVIALNYAKAPGNPFPGPLSDLEALITAVFADQDLAPLIKQDKAGIAGFSAGGNLALAISQFPTIRDKITAGIVPIYPVIDFSVDPEQKKDTRRYKSALGGSRGGDTDPLLAISAVFDWSYIPVGHDVRDPLLSPVYAERSSLPRRIWLVGCELDMLGHECWRLACRLAGREVPGLDQPIGQEEPEQSGEAGALIIGEDDRFSWEEKDRDGEIKWLCVPDVIHGFDMSGVRGSDEKALEDARLKRDQIIKMAGEWLFGT
ncbi:Acetyl esterase [Cytospora mali]|uniref:Acetyl esterase n=1 Tax=Cytospora mali TaxID=578113 RepID=A0A194VNM1_CYTMA|nr:Acetyl esterase [Valsa mali]